MPCYHPLDAWRSKELTKNGKRGITFSAKEAFIDLPITVACGQCIGCRLEKSRQWAMRCVHEAQYHEDNCFITLTYDNENLPGDANLNKQDFQNFMKRLRKHIAPKRIRFYHCGEYGANNPENKQHQAQYGISKLGRPHYHALIFGHDFHDKEHYMQTKSGNDIYRSQILESLWNKGFSSIGTLTFDSAAYVARYITKKQNGKESGDHYTRTSLATGETITLEKEYTTMSRGGRPTPGVENLGGIGQSWFNDHALTDLYPKDFTTHNGKQVRAPKYYDNLLEAIDAELLENTKAIRKRKAITNGRNSTSQGLVCAKINKLRQNKMLVRALDGDPND